MKKLIRFLFSPFTKVFLTLMKPFRGIQYKLFDENKRCNTCIYMRSCYLTGMQFDYCSFNDGKGKSLNHSKLDKTVCRHWSDDIEIGRARLNK